MKGAHVKVWSGHLYVQMRNDICMYASLHLSIFHPSLQELHPFSCSPFFRVQMPESIILQHSGVGCHVETFPLVTKIILAFPKVIPGISKVVLVIPKVVLGVPKVVLGIPKVVLAVPKVVLAVPKVVLGIPKVILGIPKVVLAVPKVVLGIPLENWAENERIK